MREKWLIDGHNLLYAVSISREKLFAQLANFASAAEVEVLVVMDGVGRDEELEPYQTAGFRAVYSQKVSADAAIERELCQHKERVRFTVVTDDRAVAAMSRGSGASVLAIDEFRRRLSETLKETQNVLFKNKVKAHGFHRPFEKKLKDKDEPCPS